MSEKEIPNNWTGQCFVCSKSNNHGLGLRFWHSEKGSFTRCSIPDHLCGLDGIVHGGIISLLLDEVALWTIIGQLGKMGVTREISVRFFKPVPTNSELLVEGQIIEEDNKNISLHSTIYSKDEVLLAESESTWILTSLSTMAKISNVDESTLQSFLT